MAQVTLRPGAVVGTGTTGATSATIVGPPPQWADDSDATYANMVSVRSGGSSTNEIAYAPLDLLTVDPASVTDITWHMRVASTPDLYFHDVWLSRPGEPLFSIVTAGNDWGGLLTSTPEWRSGTFDYLHGASMWETATALTQGSFVAGRALLPSGTADTTTQLRIYEFYLVVTTAGRRLPPHNRIVQRGNDGLGLTGGQRVVQRRTIQASNRVVGIR